jgi:hypothetical protein
MNCKFLAVNLLMFNKLHQWSYWSEDVKMLLSTQIVVTSLCRMPTIVLTSMFVTGIIYLQERLSSMDVRPREGSGVAGKAFRSLSLACVCLKAEAVLITCWEKSEWNEIEWGQNELINWWGVDPEYINRERVCRHPLGSAAPLRDDPSTRRL